MIPDPEEQPTMALWPEVGHALGLSRNTVYEQARLYERTNGAEGIPVIRFGTRLRVPTAALREMLGMAATNRNTDRVALWKEASERTNQELAKRVRRRIDGLEAKVANLAGPGRLARVDANLAADIKAIADIVASLATKDPTVHAGQMEDLICALCNGPEIRTDNGYAIEHEPECPWLQAQEWRQ